MVPPQASHAAVIGMALLLVACGGGGTGASTAATRTPSPTPDDAGPVTVALLDFNLVVEPTAAAAGTITFAVRNGGEVPHDFVVVATELDAAALPVEQLKVDETAVEVVDRLEVIEPGATEELTVELEPGHYVLICNLAGHYDPAMDVGMRANFEVT